MESRVVFSSIELVSWSFIGYMILTDDNFHHLHASPLRSSPQTNPSAYEPSFSHNPSPNALSCGSRHKTVWTHNAVDSVHWWNVSQAGLAWSPRQTFSGTQRWRACSFQAPVNTDIWCSWDSSTKLTELCTYFESKHKLFYFNQNSWGHAAGRPDGSVPTAVE
jgi:hypothetical protein